MIMCVRNEKKNKEKRKELENVWKLINRGILLAGEWSESCMDFPMNETEMPKKCEM